MIAAATHASSTEIDLLRRAMAGPPSRFKPATHLLNTREAWRIVQVRQLFRFSLEALFYWTIANLEGKPKSTDALVDLFLDQILSARRNTNARKWLAAALPLAVGPTELIKEIEEALNGSPSPDLPQTIIRGIAFCLAEAPQQENQFERPDRLPLIRARREAVTLEKGSTKDFIRHVFESWVLAQHVYWSVGRGLADARAQGKTLLRLKVVLDEGGWSLAPGVSRGSRPLPTPDRLETIVSLAAECGLLRGI